MTLAPPFNAAALLDELERALPSGVLMRAPIDARHLKDWMVSAPVDSPPTALARPRSTDEVAAVLRICNAHRVPVVPQGGLTGLTGGADHAHSSASVWPTSGRMSPSLPDPPS